VLTHDRLDELVRSNRRRWTIARSSNGTRTISVKFMKVDCLALGMLTCMKKADLLAEHKGEHFTLATIPAEDAETYDMICKADTLACSRSNP
jgi:error-prone DNA polymerase